jgi:hypothetical protein
MCKTASRTTVGLTLILASCAGAESRSQTPPSKSAPSVAGPDIKAERSDGEALLKKVREVLPEGWEAALYWAPEDPGFKPPPLAVDWLTAEWRNWLPGLDGRRIEVRRSQLVEFWVDVPGPDPQLHYRQKEVECLRFALTLSERRRLEEIKQRLAKLDAKIRELEVVLKPSFRRREEDGYAQYSVPQDDRGRLDLQEYNCLWAIKRWFPQWTEGNLSVGFRSLIWLRILPEEAQQEYREVKGAVLNVLEPLPDWGLIPAAEE